MELRTRFIQLGSAIILFACLAACQSDDSTTPAQTEPARSTSTVVPSPSPTVEEASRTTLLDLLEPTPIISQEAIDRLLERLANPDLDPFVIREPSVVAVPPRSTVAPADPGVDEVLETSPTPVPPSPVNPRLNEAWVNRDTQRDSDCIWRTEHDDAKGYTLEIDYSDVDGEVAPTVPVSYLLEFDGAQIPTEDFAIRSGDGYSGRTVSQICVWGAFQRMRVVNIRLTDNTGLSSNAFTVNVD